MNNDLNSILTENHVSFLGFMKGNYPIFHNSNLFFRDFQYGIKRFLENKGYPITIIDAKELAFSFSKFFEKNEIFIPITKNTWKLNYPDFVTKVPGDPL